MGLRTPRRATHGRTPPLQPRRTRERGLHIALNHPAKHAITFIPSASLTEICHFASHRYEDFQLLMPLYVCRVWKGRLEPSEGQALAWVKPARLADYPMPPADVPLVALLRDLL